MSTRLNAACRVTRTVFQALVGAASMSPLVYAAATQHDPAAATGWAATGLAITGGVTRVMALPAVEAFLERFAPFLAAKPAPDEAEHVPERALDADGDGQPDYSTEA